MGKKRCASPEKPADRTKFKIRTKSSKSRRFTATIDFKPGTKHELHKKHKGSAIYPVFNKDKRFFTPTFVLKNVGGQTIQQLKRIHQRKIIEYTTEIDADDILFPKPRSRYMYCMVCKDPYNDYKQHIESEVHKNFHFCARYTRHINQLCDKFSGKKQTAKYLDQDFREFNEKIKAEDSYGSSVDTGSGVTGGSTKSAHKKRSERELIVLSD